MLTIFGNLWINTPEKLKHMKDSYASFCEISDDWVINVRGKYRVPATEFLKTQLGGKLVLVELLDESRGWSNNALEMVKQAKYKYILLWNEDHINQAPQSIYKEIMKEMSAKKVDTMWYSWWLNGKSRANYDSLKQVKGKHIDTLKLTREDWAKVNRPGYQFYIITMMSIFDKRFFVRLLEQDAWMYPFSYTQHLFSAIDWLSRHGFWMVKDEVFMVINRLFKFRFRKFSEVTPFNLEKEQYRFDLLPIKIALPKRELFACIEDDLLEPSYSLISRGLYKGRGKVRNWG